MRGLSGIACGGLAALRAGDNLYRQVRKKFIAQGKTACVWNIRDSTQTLNKKSCRVKCGCV